MSKVSEYSEPTANVKMVRDSNGGLWLCEVAVGSDSDLAASGCVRAEEIVYDRMFGG